MNTDDTREALDRAIGEAIEGAPGELIDTALAAHEQAIRAEAWEEGARHGWGRSNDCGFDGASYAFEEAEFTNPYIESEATDE